MTINLWLMIMMETEPIDRVEPVVNDEVSNSVLHDCRRPGRNDNPNPELLPLLRGAARANTTLVIEFAKDPNTLSAARGIIWGMLLSAMIWVPVALTVWLLD